MRRRRTKPVPTTAIRREIDKVQKMLRALRRKASLQTPKKINLKLRDLRRCEKLLEDIWGW